MKHPRLWKPSFSQGKDARPGDRTSLTAATQSAPPERQHPISKDTQAGKVFPAPRTLLLLEWEGCQGRPAFGRSS